MKTPTYAHYAKHWILNQQYCFLNHGSFGACPEKVLNYQRQLLLEMEQQPVKFMVRDLEERWHKARVDSAAFLNSDFRNLVFVKNATAGVNTVLNSLNLNSGDEVIVTNHIYGACFNILTEKALKTGFKISILNIDLPVQSEQEVVQKLNEAIKPNTRLLLIDHVTSPTAIVFPIEKIVRSFEEKNIEVLVDGAHAPGMLDLSPEKIGASYYVGNFHKWVCSPKGSAFLYVREDKKSKIKPFQVSHSYKNTIESDSWSRDFFWPGTDDFSAFLSVPFAIEFMRTVLPGGWPELREKNNQLALRAKNVLESKLSVFPSSPEEMLGSMALVYLGEFDFLKNNFNKPNPIQNFLFEKYKIEVPIVNFPYNSNKYWVRISAQVYNQDSQYVYLLEALEEYLFGQ